MMQSPETVPENDKIRGERQRKSFRLALPHLTEARFSAGEKEGALRVRLLLEHGGYGESVRLRKTPLGQFPVPWAVDLIRASGEIINSAHSNGAPLYGEESLMKYVAYFSAEADAQSYFDDIKVTIKQS